MPILVNFITLNQTRLWNWCMLSATYYASFYCPIVLSYCYVLLCMPVVQHVWIPIWFYRENFSWWVLHTSCIPYLIHAAYYTKVKCKNVIYCFCWIRCQRSGLRALIALFVLCPLHILFLWQCSYPFYWLLH